MEFSVVVHVVAALISFFVAGCLLGALLSDVGGEKMRARLSLHPLSLKRLPSNAYSYFPENMRRRMPNPTGPTGDGTLAPIVTARGWLILHHPRVKGTPSGDRLEAMLTEPNAREKVLYRAAFPVLCAEKPYEREGGRGVIRAFSAEVRDGRLIVHYRGRAQRAYAASAPLEAFVDELVKSSRFAAPSEERPALLLAPQGDGFESRAIESIAAMELNGATYLFYEAKDKQKVSRIGLALSLDGKDIHDRLSEPVYRPRAAFELPQKNGAPSGCTLPRVEYLGDRISLAYTARDGVYAPLRAVSSISIEDFIHRRFDRWSIPSPLAPGEADFSHIETV